LAISRYQQLRVDNFTKGMIEESQLSTMEFPPGACVECENVYFNPAGSLSKRPGYEALNSTIWSTGGPITRLTSFTTTGGINYALTFSCSASTGSACIAAVETDGTDTDIAVFNNIAVTGTWDWDPIVDEPITVAAYAGSAVFTHWGANATNIPTVWPATTATATCVDVSATISGAKVCAAWGNYLFLGNVVSSADGIRRGSRIHWNASGQIDSWPAAQYIDLDADDGDEITSMCIYKDKLIVFKKYKMWKIHYVGGSLMFQEERVSTSIGCVGPNAYIDNGGTLYFIGAYTAYAWEGSGEPETISDNIQSQWDDINMEYSRICEVESDDSNFQIWFHVPHGGNQRTKNRLYVYDTRFKAWTRFNISAYSVGGFDYGAIEAYLHKPNAYSTYGTRIRDALSNKEGVLAFGGAGYLYRYGSVDNDAGAAIEGYWISPWYTFDNPIANKRLMRITAFVSRQTTDMDYDLHVDLYRDWNDTTADEEKTVSLSSAIDYPTVEKRIDFTKQLRSARFKIFTDGTDPDTPFTLHKLIIDWVPKGLTLVS
jgi:hypothetical protein